MSEEVKEVQVEETEIKKDNVAQFVERFQKSPTHAKMAIAFCVGIVVAAVFFGILITQMPSGGGEHWVPMGGNAGYLNFDRVRSVKSRMNIMVKVKKAGAENLVKLCEDVDIADPEALESVENFVDNNKSFSDFYMEGFIIIDDKGIHLPTPDALGIKVKDPEDILEVLQEWRKLYKNNILDKIR